MPPIFLITGSPASGKSTASRALAAKFPKSIVICVDDVRNMVVSALALPSPSWSNELVEQLQLARQSATMMAKTYHNARYAVVIDDFWDPHTRMAEYNELSATGELKRVLLYPDQQKVHAQNLQRSGPGQLQDYLDGGIEFVYADLNSAVGDLARDGWTVLDTTDDAVEDTVARLQALVKTAAEGESNG